MIALLTFCLAAAEPLTLGQALELARAHQPQLRAARNATLAAQARADAARAPLLPQVTGTASYQRLTANYVGRPGNLPTQFGQSAAADSSRSFDFYNAGLGLTQLVYDFGQTTDTWSAAQAGAAAEESTEQAVRLEIDWNVRMTYFSARAQKALVEVARATLTNQERHLAQVESFVQVGRRPAIDLAQLRTERANAVVLLINAENNYATALAQLGKALGSTDTTDYDVVDGALPGFAGEDAASATLLEEALANLPELAALEQQLRAQDLVFGAARGRYGPSLSLAGGVTDAGPALDDLAWNWNAGVQLTWPLFEGGLTWSKTREARANLEVLRAQKDDLQQSIALAVEQARLALRAAKAALEATGQAVASSQEQLRLAEARYETGVGNAIELGDAQLAVTNATAQQVQAEFQLSAARAQLLKALGRS